MGDNTVWLTTADDRTHRNAYIIREAFVYEEIDLLNAHAYAARVFYNICIRFSICGQALVETVAIIGKWS